VKYWSKSALVMSMAMLAASQAKSQTLPGMQSVGSRVPRGYEAYPHPVGSFNLFPSLITDLRATDNFRASSINPQSDFYVTLAPQLQARSNWSRHRLNASAYFSQSIHANLTTENVSQFGAEANGQIEITRATRINFDGTADQQVENRADLGAQQGLPIPVTFRTLGANIGLTHDANQLTLNGSLGVNRVDFSNPTTASGIVVDQTFRDSTRYTGVLGASYDLRSGVSIVVRGQYDEQQFPFGPGSPGFDPAGAINRNSKGYVIEGGVALELSSLIVGTLRVGHLDRQYEDPRLQDVSGLSYSVDLLWNATPLTSLRLRAGRTIEDTASTIAAGNTRDQVEFIVEHELYRNLLLTGDLRYSEFSPNGPGSDGQEFSAGLAARYRIDRHWTINGRLAYDQRTSPNPSLAFDATSGQIAVAYAF
jgi:hypothetical protein